MSKIIDWRNKTSLENLSPSEAVMVLGQITESLQRRESTATLDHEDRRIASAFSASAEAQQFADAANALGRKLRSVNDCRPSLRQTADAKRDATPEEDAAAFAEQMRQYHRK
jgi:hypothetical protein